MQRSTYKKLLETINRIKKKFHNEKIFILLEAGYQLYPSVAGGFDIVSTTLRGYDKDTSGWGKPGNAGLGSWFDPKYLVFRGMDFVSLKGIKTKIGVDEDKLLIFVLKELIDNALNFIDRSGKPNPVVSVIVKKVEEGNKIKVTVANSDFDLTRVGFTESSIKNIFDLAGYYSTKRNQYRITRGALGDALKTVLGIPYALAFDNGIKGWNEPLIIKSGKNVFTVSLDVDKKSQSVSSKVRVNERAEVDAAVTVVEITLPMVEGLSLSVENYLFEYLCLNPHINFCFDTIYCQGVGSCFEGNVAKVVDGDTLDIDNLRIRLTLVNTHETYQYVVETNCGVGIRAMVDEDDGQKSGSYGRMIGLVFCENLLPSLNKAVLTSGNAEILPQYCDASEFSGKDWARQYGC